MVLAIMLVIVFFNYLSNWQHRVKIGHGFSTWMDLTKGVGIAGYILEPQLLNIFFNDIYFFVEVTDDLNYAGDNTVSHTDEDLKSIYEILTQQSEITKDWLTIN